MSERGGGGRGGGRGRGGGGGGRGRGRGRGGVGGGRGGGGQQQQEDGAPASGGGGGGEGRAAGRNAYEDEFDVGPETRQIKGDEDDDYGVGAGAGGGDDDFDDDDDDDGAGKAGRRMTKQFAWEEERMEEEFNEAGDRMEPFNLKTERNEGYFDETGNYVWRREEGGNDPWLASLENEEDMEARIGEAAEAQRKREEAEAEVEEPPEEVDKEGIMARIARILQPGETVLRALKRLGPKRPAPGGGGGGGGGGGQKKGAVVKSVDERTPAEKQAFDDLTELADQLLRAGDVDIYQQTPEELKAAMVKLAAQEMADLRRKRPASALAGGGGGGGGNGPTWEYRGPDGQVHGPYSTAEIMAWRAQGFFTGPTAVEMRRVGTEGPDAKKRQATGAAAGGNDDGTGVKKVSFSADALAADFDDDDDDDEEEDEGAGKGKGPAASGGGDGKGTGEWVSSDAVDWAAAMQG